MKMETSPGKFEGEPAYLRWLWENIVLDGGGDFSFYNDYDNEVDIIKLTPGETVDLEEAGLIEDDELNDIHAVAIWEDNNGFVYHKTFKTAEDLDKFVEANEGNE